MNVVIASAVRNNNIIPVLTVREKPVARK